MQPTHSLCPEFLVTSCHLNLDLVACRRLITAFLKLIFHRRLREEYARLESAHMSQKNKVLVDLSHFPGFLIALLGISLSTIRVDHVVVKQTGKNPTNQSNGSSSRCI